MPAAINRRQFVAQTAAIASLSSAMIADPLRHENLGVQLYTVRDLLPKDPSGVLKQIKDIGYLEVEATDYGTFDTFSKALSSSGLKPISIHMNPAQLEKSTSDIDSRMALFKMLGFHYVVFPYVAPKMRGGADVYKTLAEKLNKAGASAKQHGLRLCYHNHAFEFQEMDGTSPLKLLMEGTEKENLALEMDIFWVTVAGHDPVELLKTYSGRVPLLHVKDKAKGIPAAPQFNETVPKETFKEAGNGSIDIPAVLKAANSAGVKHYFVEQDQSPDPMASLKQSYEYLSKHFAT
jgi:sugar phosphate isomerase/epimerase